jgi:heme a synthase
VSGLGQRIKPFARSFQALMAVSAARSEVLAAPERRAVRSPGAVRSWLYLLAALVVAMVAIGGTTRLTGSGLSITEWKPVTGAIPPLSESAWLAEFDKYRASPQYRLLNQGMSLGDFRFIYWWEWAHRQLGRFLGLAFFAPLLWFWLKGYLTRRLALALLATGALGGLQAAVGWIMVASGLKPGMTAVAPIKLTLHLLLASGILAALLWLATGLRDDRGPGVLRHSGAGKSASDRLPSGVLSARLLLGLIFLQIALGGLVAGSKAGLAYNTWPLMDGRFAPPLAGLFAVSPWIENFVDNVALVQLNHRMVAYVVVGFALWHAFAVRKGDRTAALVAALALAQMTLGIATLLLAVPLWAGLAHQLLAMALLAATVIHLRHLANPAPLSSH